MGFSGSPGPVMRQKAKGTRPLRNLLRAAARRHGYAGFPIPPRQFTAAEVEEYLAGETITCLLCGRGFRRLAQHLPAIHQVTVDDYRDMYGLPWRTGVASRASRDAYAAAQKKNIADGKVKIPERPPPGPFHMRPRRYFHKEKLKEVGFLGVLGPVYGRADFFATVDRVLSGEKFQVGDGGPSETWFHKWAREHPEDDAEFRRAIDALPFPRQAALSYGMGPRFTGAVRDLRATGLSDKRIAAVLGVSTMTVFHRRRREGIK